MKKALIVTGTPGTGKTNLAHLLTAKHNADYVDVHALILKHRLAHAYDRSYKTYLVDIKKVVALLIPLIKHSSKVLVIDSHLSHYIPSKYVQRCYVTMCALPVLKRRLERRNYSNKKIRENLDAEILQVCLLEAITQKHKIKVIDTTKGLKRI